MLNEEWFDDYADAVYSYILLMVEDRHLAEDLTQETFLKVFTKASQFKGESAVKTWIFRIAYTTTIDYFRANKGHLYYLNLNYLKAARSSEEEMLLHAEQQQFYEILKNLKPNYQQVIILREIKAFSTKETAEVLNWSEGKVKMTLLRALKQFKKDLMKGGFSNETIIR